MSLSLHNLKIAHGSTKAKVRIGRGNSSGRGTYSTRGMKGQRSRTGSSGLKYLGMKAAILSLPKLGGFKSIAGKMAILNIADLEKNFKDGALVNLVSAKAKNLIRKNDQRIKILGSGELTKKLVIKVDAISASARVAIEKAGGKVVTPIVKEKK